MPDDSVSLYVLLAMAVSTYALRVAGLSLARVTSSSPQAAMFLQRMSSGALIGIVVVALVEGDWIVRTSVLLAAAIAALTRNVLVAMVGAAALAAVLRHMLTPL